MKYKKYKDFSEIHPHQEIKILTSDIEWNNHVGVVEKVNYNKDDSDSNIAIVFCIEKPDCRYLVFSHNLDTVVMVK